MYWEKIILHNKSLRRNMASVTIVVAAVLVTFFPIYRRLFGECYGSKIAYVYSGSIRAIAYLFILCLFAGFYTSRLLVEAGLTELFPMHAIRAYTISCMQWGSLGIILLIVFLLFPSGIAYFLDGRSYADFFAETLTDLLLYALTSGIIAFLAGYLFGMIRNLYVSLIAVLFLSLAVSPMMWNIGMSGFSLFGWIVFLTPFVPRGNQFDISYHYWQFGWYRGCNAIAWIGLLLLALSIVLHSDMLKKVIASAVVVLSIVIIIFSERTLTGMEWPEGTMANYYYRLSEDVKKGHYVEGVKNEVCEEFRIAQYSLDINCIPFLSAEVTMEVADRKSEEGPLTFTLYHGYTIRTVEDEEGNELSYERNGNWFSVMLPADQTKLKVRYFGKNGPCYAGIDGIYLRAGFPYYPIAGKQNPETSKGAFQICRQLEADFSVTIHSCREVYSNLSGKANSFYGCSEAPMFVCGYLTERTIAGTRIILPEKYLMSMKEEEENRWVQLVEQSIVTQENLPDCIIFGNSAAEVHSSENMVFADYLFFPGWKSLQYVEKYGFFDEKRRGKEDGHPDEIGGQNAN